MFRTIALWKFRKIVVVAMGALVPCLLVRHRFQSASPSIRKLMGKQGPMIAVMYVYVNHLTCRWSLEIGRSYLNACLP